MGAVCQNFGSVQAKRAFHQENAMSEAPGAQELGSNTITAW
jgi:hypothetical protein